MADVMSYTPCQCGCRPASAEQPGCPCPECQPGPGLDPLAGAGRKERQRRSRTVQLLRKQVLTPQEQTELDRLLDWHIHAS